MLPWMSKKNSPSLIVSETFKSEDDRPTEELAIEACSQDLIDAIHEKDFRKVSKALVAAFQILESLPHEEAEHMNDYDHQNELAAEYVERK